MRKWFNIPAILVVLVLLLGIAAAACSSAAEQKAAPPKSTGPITINVGLPTPLSGPAAPWGQATQPGYDAWLDIYNKAGGFKVGDQSYIWKLYVVDDENSPDAGAAAAKELIFSDGCKFIAGYWSSGYPAVTAVTNAAKIIFVGRTGNEAVPGGAYDPAKQPYTVFGNPSHEQFIADCHAIVKAFPNYKRIGIVDTTLGKGVGWDYVDKDLDASGIRYHHEWSLPNTTDFAPYIANFAKAGCDIVYSADIGAAMNISKQRWELGYKDWHVGHAGGIVDPALYNEICGTDAAQGFIGQSWAPWFYKETTVNPDIIAMCKQVEQKVTEDQGSPWEYTGWVGWLPNHLLILSQAMQKAGTVDDPDAIMKAIKGGTFDTTVGKWTMSGAKTYGSPVVFGSAGCLSMIQGSHEVYLSESPMQPLP